MDVRIGLWGKLSTKELMFLNCGVGEDSWEFLGLQGDQTNHKGNQHRVFTGRTDAEAETPILWLPDAKNELIGKGPDPGNAWRWEEKGTTARSQREELRPWQRSWGRRLRHTQRRDQASGNPVFPSIYPKSQSLPTLLFYALTYTSDFTGGCSPTIPLGEGVNLQLQLTKIPGCDKSVSTYELLWRFSSLPEQVRPATCNCL